MDHGEEFKVGFSSLTRGELYPIVKAEKLQSTFHGKQVNVMKVTLLDDELEIVTYLPKKCVDQIDDAKLAAINAAGTTVSKYTTCFYGKVETKQTTTFFGRVHSPQEGRSEKLFQDMTKMMAKYSTSGSTPEKRKREDASDDSPCKVAKSDN